MIVIELRFPTGRFHATPWGRNVNEGAAEWPPSPYRLARALLDVYHRRYADWSKDRILPLLDLLSNAPSFSLPPTRNSHVRSFMSQNREDPTKKQKIFDAFVVLSSDASVFCGFPGDLNTDQREDLNTLLTSMPYLGRSESWVEARLADSAGSIDWNCLAAEPGKKYGSDVELRRVACLASAAGFAESSCRTAAKLKLDWVDAIELSTGELLREGWSQPPAMTFRDYLIPRSLSIRGFTKTQIKASTFQWARFSLAGKVMPSIRETVPFAERVRRKLMGIHRRLMGDDPRAVSWKFSGKTTDGTPAQGHTHAFFLPADCNSDGELDTLYISVKDPFDSCELKALDLLRSIWQTHSRPDVHLILSGLSDEKPFQKETVWQSSTPFVAPRHYRKGRGDFTAWLKNEVERECQNHGLPPVRQLRLIDRSECQKPEKWLSFDRGEKSAAINSGHGFQIEFAEPVDGPFALGSRCHYGLGFFLPQNVFLR